MSKALRKGLFWLVNAAALLLALTFLFSGWVKANDPIGTMFKLADYTAAMGIPLGEGLLLLTAAIALAFVEFSLGVCLLFGLNRKFVPRLTLLLMAVMTLLTLWLALFNPVEDCGCFGDALILTNTETLLKNLVLTACALLVWWRPRYQMRLVRTSGAWLISTPLMAGIVCYAFYCINYLPVVDFRPWHVGADVRHMMEHPVLHSPHSYRIHELDVADFYAYDTANGDDRTADLIYAEGPVMLIVAPDLSAADQGCVGLLNEAYDYAVLHGIPCYCLTASDAEAQANWNEHTGAEYPCLQSDERMLKTIVRANPGLVVLSDGKVVAKWSNWNLPDEAELDSLLFPRQPQPTQFNH
ncbi:MAG: DoxX family protein [Bacteroidaceae bacterium]|nr:DoxX family protein [Bacteroidaceae bacterium]MBR3442136.1 DoxX family protein [Bacteroidaceae bacterium]